MKLLFITLLALICLGQVHCQRNLQVRDLDSIRRAYTKRVWSKLTPENVKWVERSDRHNVFQWFNYLIQGEDRLVSGRCVKVIHDQLPSGLVSSDEPSLLKWVYEDWESLEAQDPRLQQAGCYVESKTKVKQDTDRIFCEGLAGQIKVPTKKQMISFMFDYNWRAMDEYKWAKAVAENKEAAEARMRQDHIDAHRKNEVETQRQIMSQIRHFCAKKKYANLPREQQVQQTLTEFHENLENARPDIYRE